ncbi:hypothetical protein ScPMuIL_005823 [Solemya velum]
MPIHQVRQLTLNGGENKQHTLYRLEKGWLLKFILGPSLHASHVRIFCNHPQDKAAEYKKDTYYELEWRNPSSSTSDRHDVYAEVLMVAAGSFRYYFTVDDSVSPDNANGSGYFLVDPTLSFGGDEDDITMDCIQCQTVISKLLGPFEEWERRLLVAKETGYNMIHFTPIQELGLSNSAYSIRDQRVINPLFNKGGKNYQFPDIEKFNKKMRKEWKMLSLTDLVYNHTATDSPWVLENPECAYNLDNSPHLKPAYLVDRIFNHFSIEVANGKWKHRDIPVKIKTDADLHAIRHVLHTEVFPRYKMSEFYTVNLELVLKQFKQGIQENKIIQTSKPHLEIIQDPQFRRSACTIDMDTALRLYNIDRPHVYSREERIKVCCTELRSKIEELNGSKMHEMEDHINSAVNHFIENVRWRFLTPDGPQIGTVTIKEPLMHNYFVHPASYEGTVESEEQQMYGPGCCYIMATNGWVMGDDPLRNFAEPGVNVYLRRELICWGDSVKLRYGKSPKDSPFLWKHMKDYTETTARLFDAVRLDNCHSTPLHVAEYMLDAARKIRPNLYVVAELFTGSETIDNLFMNKLGINSLIRESLAAWDAHEEGRLVYKYGGQPVGSFIQPRVRPLLPTTAHALFFDQTHDNMSPIEKRSAYDLLPSGALVAMSNCAIGSNRGYDQLVPHHIHVVTEERLYTSWADWDFPENPYINLSFGISAGKKALNELHYEMALKGFTEVYVDQLDACVVSVTRHNPHTHDSIILVARTAFQKPENPKETGYIKPLVIHGSLDEIILEGGLVHTEAYSYEKNPYFINGLPSYYLELRQHIKVEESKMIKVVISETGEHSVHFVKFTPGSVVAFRISLPSEAKTAILDIRRGVGQFGYLMRSYSGKTMFDDTWDKSNFHAIVSNLSLADINRVLYRCDSEDQADGKGFGAYGVPGWSPMVYCGLRGVMAMLKEIRLNNDLGHPLCNNLRDGNWLPEYMAARLKVHPETEILGCWFESIFKHLGKIPRYLIPCYFDTIVTGAYVVIRHQAIQLMSDFIKDGSTFVQVLSLGSVQFCGYVKSSRLPQLSPNLLDPKPPVIINEETKEKEQACLSLAAGFPHFASGYMRNWGRDTFIALRGLLLLTGRFQEARYIILAYAGTLRHGLIPNLLNEGTGSRYNCRDAVWWWLQAIQEYTKLAPGGPKILTDLVSRMYPVDESEPQEPGTYDQPLSDVIQEALQRHAEGLKYRERNAGSKIDCNMTDEGFECEIGVKWDLGFVYGGNEWNCGTWMDKMGSSEKAKNKGKPSTARNGTPVEIIGLCKSALRWLVEMHAEGHYPYDSVKATQDGQSKKITFKEWGELIKANFERYFWINSQPIPGMEPNPELINRRGIYKDSYFATPFWSDFQLRPNFSVAMVVAPELFTPQNAWTALLSMDDVLHGPLGMKTLDPRDWSYAGDYDNANDSDDAKVAHGANYHQGPEWVWPLGYFLRAKLLFAQILGEKYPDMLKQATSSVKTSLTRHYEEIMKSAWQSLPELTNSNGQFCRDSCPAQAWSVGCLLEVLYDLEHLEDKHNLAATYKSPMPNVGPL